MIENEEPDLQLPDLPLQVVDEERAREEMSKSLYKTAFLLEQKFSKRVSPDLESLSQELGVQRKALQDRFFAVAEAALQHQIQQYNELASHSRRLACGEGCEQILFLEHMVYDETPLRTSVRLSGGRHTETAKVFVLELGWKMLLRMSTDDKGPAELSGSSEQAIVASQNNYLLLCGQYSIALRLGEGTSGEAVAAILRTCPNPPDCATDFRFHSRLAEIDEAGGNKRAEAMLRSGRPDSWTYLTSHCLAHKVHNAAERTWAVSGNDEIISGLIHVALFLKQPGTTQKFRKAVTTVLENRELNVTWTPCAAHATEWRETILRLFAPPASKHANRHALVKVVSTELLNGDWTCQTLQHHCQGCCSDATDTRRKIMMFVPRVVVSLPTIVFHRSDWAGWRRAGWQAGLLESMHHVFAESFVLAFSMLPPAVPDLGLPLDSDEQLHLPPVLGEQHVQEEAADRYRQESLQYQRQALAFLQKKSWHARLIVLFQGLQPQLALMDRILSGTSMQTELQQQLLEPGDRSTFRVLQWQAQGPQDAYLSQCLQNLQNASLWGTEEAGDTEEFRTTVFITSMRGAAVVYQNISLPCAGYPSDL